jgi:hypothetical protein
VRPRFRSAFRTLIFALCGCCVPACNSRFDFDSPSATGGAAGMPQAGASATAGTPAAAGNASAGMAPSAGTDSGGASGSAGTDSGGASGSAGAGGMPVVNEMCGTLAACPAPLHCANAVCAQCSGDTDCSSPGLSRCDPKRSRCVQCLESADCDAGFACDALANRCLQKCKQDVDCPAGSHGCDERRLVCYQCDENEECKTSPLGHLCATDGSGCVQCLKEVDCPGQHCDQLTGRCVACRVAQDCVSGLCDPSVGVCLL